ncbi:MAG: phosphatase PAP2 family protein [Alphaproteobacteria bacterium]
MSSIHDSLTLPARAADRGFRALLAETAREHRWFAAIVLAYVGAGLAAARAFGRPEMLKLSLYSGEINLFVGLFLFGALVCRMLYVMVAVRPRRLSRYLIDDLKANLLAPRRLAYALPVWILIPVFISVFTSLKTMIPFVNPELWDVPFAAWDRTLHGGIDPWRLLQPMLGTPLVTSALNFVYHLWFFVLHAVLLWQTFSLADPRLRMQFLLTFLLSWALLGSLAATVFASVGPVYFGAATGLEDPFAGLMAYLNEANQSYPVWALEVQQGLWENYRAGDIEIASGVSAMPSMHIASSFLFALLGWRVNRLLGIAFSVFCLLILVGSVHLGWHYAIDGYAAVAGVWLIWRMVGALLARRRDAPATPATPVIGRPPPAPRQAASLWDR